LAEIAEIQDVVLFCIEKRVSNSKTVGKMGFKVQNKGKKEQPGSSGDPIFGPA